MKECKCGSQDMEVIIKGTQKGLYCAECGKWQKWIGKDEYNKFLIEKQRRCNNA